ncbi:CapA family protein [Salinibacterium sp. TMP30]|uniref:CapA family protein n=1 Tax=Salinibacterium sp. TMP30 TaxID=3138237 RepID=UPI003138DD6E
MNFKRLSAVGDVLIDRDEPATAFTPSRAVLQDSDVLFGNCEAVYADGAQPAPSASIPVLGKPEHATGLGVAGFDIMSLANNHTVDGGYEGLLQTRETLRAQGIDTCGAGANAAEARAPIVVERGDWSVAFLAYSCEYPAGYGAGEDRPGIATIRTHTIYVPSEMNAFQSGGAPDRLTIADPRDLATVSREVEAADKLADVVVVSVHAGDGSRPAVIMDFERQIARAVIDAGADVYLGHHHHMLRGAEYHHGKPIFYGLGHFVFDVLDFESQVPPSVLARMKEHAGEYGYGYREGYPLLPMHPEARMSMVAVCDFMEDGSIRAGAVPCRLNPEGQPIPLSLNDAAGREVEEYLGELNTSQGLRGRWQPSQTTVAGFPLLELVAAEAQ